MTIADVATIGYGDGRKPALDHDHQLCSYENSVVVVVADDYFATGEMFGDVDDDAAVVVVGDGVDVGDADDAAGNRAIAVAKLDSVEHCRLLSIKTTKMQIARMGPLH